MREVRVGMGGETVKEDGEWVREEGCKGGEGGLGHCEDCFWYEFLFTN